MALITTTSEWRTSTRSGDNSGHCVQIALWRKASRGLAVVLWWD